MATSNGTIKRLVRDKGFGFIAASDGNEYFFHQSACQQVPFDELREGQAVTFDKGQGPKGPRGENVRPAYHTTTQTRRCPPVWVPGHRQAAGECVGRAAAFTGLLTCLSA